MHIIGDFMKMLKIGLWPDSKHVIDISKIKMCCFLHCSKRIRYLPGEHPSFLKCFFFFFWFKTFAITSRAYCLGVLVYSALTSRQKHFEEFDNGWFSEDSYLYKIVVSCTKLFNDRFTSSNCDSTYSASFSVWCCWPFTNALNGWFFE